MDVSKESLSKLVVRRRLGGGEFTYLLRRSGETVAGKKAAYNLLKEQDPEKFAACKSSCQMEGESDEDFDSRMLKLIPGLPYETEVKDEGMEVDGEQDADDEADNEQDHRQPEIAVGELFTTVKIDNVPNKATEEECETFFRQFEGVMRVKRILMDTKRNKGKPVKPSKPIFKGQYVLVFSNKEAASNFLAKPDDEVKLQDRVLSKVLLKKDIQQRVLRGQLWTSHHSRLLSCIPLEEGKEDKCLMLWSWSGFRGTELHKRELADFHGEGEHFSDIVSVKPVIHQIASQNKKRVLGHLAEFKDKDTRDKFVGLTGAGEVKFNEKRVSVNIIGDLKRDIESRYADVKPSDETNKSIVVLRIRAELEEKLKELLGGNITDIKRDNRSYIVTFDKAEDAARVISSPPEDIASVVSPTFLMSIEEYNQAKQTFLESDKARFEKQDEKYNKIKEGIKIEDNTILIVDPSKPRMEKEERKARAAEKLTEKLAKTKLTDTPVKAAPPPVPKKPMLQKRDNRGPGPFDIFVGVQGFYQKVKNMGKATDIDICNYFIHNHKNVVDVKFVNWTDIVFAKFKDSESAEIFIGLNYTMFFGNELTLVDVETFLKKRTDSQKDEVSKILLNKKFSAVNLRDAGGNVANGNAAGGVGKTQVELAHFASKQAELRNLFIENLNLNDKDVGQLNWMKDGQKGFKARIPIKLEEGAIGYLVKKWNDLQIAVGGETVSAALTTTAVKRAANQRGGRNSTGGGKRGKFNMLEDN